MDISIKKLEETDFEKLFEFELENRVYFEEIVPGRGEDYYHFDIFQKKNRISEVLCIKCQRRIFQLLQPGMTAKQPALHRSLSLNKLISIVWIISTPVKRIEIIRFFIGPFLRRFNHTYYSIRKKHLFKPLPAIWVPALCFCQRR